MERRGSERMPARGSVDCAVDMVVRRSELADMSSSGCRLVFGEDEPVAGAPVEIMLLRGVTVRGEVRWIDGDAIGIAFDEPVGQAALRYFTLTEQGMPADLTPRDRFGRSLPPLGGRRAGQGASTVSRADESVSG